MRATLGSYVGASVGRGRYPRGVRLGHLHLRLERQIWTTRLLRRRVWLVGFEVSCHRELCSGYREKQTCLVRLVSALDANVTGLAAPARGEGLREA